MYIWTTMDQSALVNVLHVAPPTSKTPSSCYRIGGELANLEVQA